MEDILDVSLVPFRSEQYLKPRSILYTQNGTSKASDLIIAHPAVAIIIFNKSRNILVFVKQFRPAIYIESIPDQDRINCQIDCDKYPATLGVTLELCAGIIDKDKSLEEIAAEEVYEECGYKVDPKALELVFSFHAETSRNGARNHLYYCEVADDMKVSEGGGIEDEMIDIVEMTVEDVQRYMSRKLVLSPPEFLFAIQWFLLNKMK